MRFLFVFGMIGFFSLCVSGMDNAASKWVNDNAKGGWAPSVKDAVMGSEYSALRDNALFRALYSEGMQTVYSTVFEGATGGMAVPLQLMGVGPGIHLQTKLVELSRLSCKESSRGSGRNEQTGATTCFYLEDTYCAHRQ